MPLMLSLLILNKILKYIKAKRSSKDNNKKLSSFMGMLIIANPLSTSSYLSSYLQHKEVKSYCLDLNICSVFKKLRGITILNSLVGKVFKGDTWFRKWLCWLTSQHAVMATSTDVFKRWTKRTCGGKSSWKPCFHSVWCRDLGKMTDSVLHEQRIPCFITIN